MTASQCSASSHFPRKGGSMSEWQPTEAKIQEVLARYTPRQIAIAYLRASRRAKDAETSFNIMGDINDLTLAAMKGDLKGAEAAVKSAGRHARSHREVTE